jgi:hypothetical protein
MGHKLGKRQYRSGYRRSTFKFGSPIEAITQERRMCDWCGEGTEWRNLFVYSVSLDECPQELYAEVDAGGWFAPVRDNLH